jgi:uncharacterized membrane protein
MENKIIESNRDKKIFNFLISNLELVRIINILYVGGVLLKTIQQVYTIENYSTEENNTNSLQHNHYEYSRHALEKQIYKYRM